LPAPPPAPPRRDIGDAWIIGPGVGHQLKVITFAALRRECALLGKRLLAQAVQPASKQNCYICKSAMGKTGHHCFLHRTGQIYTPKIAKYFTIDL
jgi:hypothetical protein